MGWNVTEIIGKLVGSGLFVYGLTDFLNEHFNQVIEQIGVATVIINKGTLNPGMLYDFSMPLIPMIIGLTLLFIKYPENK